MKAMILAAGRGTRMGSLTETLPKPLLQVKGEPLIAHQVRRLAQSGVAEVVVNLAYQGEKIRDALGSGAQYDVHIHYSEEPQEKGLETGGGVLKALPLLGEDPFLLVNGDVWTDYPFDRLQLTHGMRAHLVLVPNPSHHRTGDFVLENGLVKRDGAQKHTFSGISLLHPKLFEKFSPGFFPLREVLTPAMAEAAVTGELYEGLWKNVDTPERLAEVEALICCNYSPNGE